MTYNAPRQRVILFGGFAIAGPNSVLLADTHAFSNWGSPRIDPPPGSQTVSIGQSAIFAVVEGGDSPLSDQWRRNGSPLVGGGNLAGANSSTLIINPVGIANAGEYDDVVSNACGADLRATATLTVNIPCFGDANGDQLVNFLDLNIVLGNYGTACAPPPIAP